MINDTFESIYGVGVRGEVERNVPKKHCQLSQKEQFCQFVIDFFRYFCIFFDFHV